MDNRDTTPGALAHQQQRGLSRPVGRYNPLHEMQEQMRRMDALFNRMFGFEPMFSPWRAEFQLQPQMQSYEPDVDIFESDSEFIIHAALPGIAPENIHLEVTEDSVTLTAQRRSPFDNRKEERANDQKAESGAAGQAQPATPGANQTGWQSNAAPQSGAQTNPPANENADMPHVQHRQSRHSAQSRIRLAYTLPGSIDPDNVRATFQNGMLELHLPKQRQAVARTVPISVITGATQQAVGAGPNTAVAQTFGAGRSATFQEGHPVHKMGASYTPSAGEDHTTQAQSIGARTDHEPGRQDNPIAAGQTNPMGTSTNVNANTPAEPKRS